MFKENMTATPSKMFKIAARKGSFGIEIEIEGDGMPEPPKGWQVHQDGSLRGGVEYVTRGPVSMKELRPSLVALFDAIRAQARVRDSYRTSTHIHYNITQMPFSDVLGMLIAFSIVEPLWLRLMGPTRDGNLFCLSSYDTGDLTDFCHMLCKSVENGHFGNFQNRGKYSSLNFGRIMDLGTIEFRCFPLSRNADEICMWAQWIENLSNLVRAEENKSFRPLIKAAQANPRFIASSVFTGVDNLTAKVKPNSIEDLIMYGTETAYELSRTVKKYLAKDKPEPKKKASSDADWVIIDDVGGFAEVEEQMEQVARGGLRVRQVPQLGWAQAPNEMVVNVQPRRR